MKLIIEAGSSNTQSVLISQNGKEIQSETSLGINPITDPNYTIAIDQMCMPYKDLNINEVFYYGSGCIEKKVNNKIKDGIMNALPSRPKINVTDDLTGSAKSCCINTPGIIAIVGTGSIIGYYNGSIIIDKLSSGGYLLGDEGSGFAIGRKLMTRYMRKQLNALEMSTIRSHLGLSSSEFISSLYEQSNTRKYLAAQSKLINNVEPETRLTILNEAFDEMCHKMIVPVHNKYKVKVHFVGSIAFYFKDILVNNLKKFNILAGSFHRSAIDGLVEYHRHE